MMKQLYTVSIILACLFCTAKIFAQASFSPKTDFIAGINPISVSIRDINGDGKPDVAAANLGSNTVSVWLNTTSPGASTPSFSAKTDFTPISLYISLGDINGDGKPDLAVANGILNTVSVLLNTTASGASTPTFTVKTDFPTGSNSTYVSIGDINGDGKPDLAVVNTSSSSVSVLLNTTITGTFTPTFTAKTDFSTGSNPYSVSLGDINGDGKPDLAVANGNSNTVSVFLNTTSPGALTPTFSTRTDFTTGINPTYLSIGDINGDGKSDLIVANLVSNSVSVLLNSTALNASTPSFLTKTDFSTVSQPSFASIGDIDGDGKPDLIVANGTPSNSVSVLLNTTTTGALVPSFSARTDFATGDYPRSISAGDLNGDGKLDLAVANLNSNSISVLLNTSKISAQTGSICGVKFNDLNGNGVRDRDEPGLPEWQMDLNIATIPPARTDKDGKYCFNNLPAGTYTLTEVMQSGWQQTAPSSGRYTVTLAAGQNIDSLNFGNQRSAAPPDTCNYLVNSDFEDKQVAALGGQRFISQDSVPGWKTTASDHIIEVWGSGFGGVPAYSGNQFIELNATMVGTLYQSFTAIPGRTVTVAFARRGRAGFTNQMSVSIRPVNGVDSILGTYTSTTVWKKDSVTYTFPNTTVTAYELRFISLPVGGTEAGGNFLDAITITCATPALGSICGVKFNDLNGNGVRDRDEPGLPDWQMDLNIASIPPVRTDKDGKYCFNNLPAGTYTLTEVMQSGWQQTAPSSGRYTVTLAAGQNIDSLNFGNQRSAAPPDTCSYLINSDFEDKQVAALGGQR
ncbi:MAG: FG-GAP-like repeat-containing protein, partial [bacterium]